MTIYSAAALSINDSAFTTTRPKNETSDSFCDMFLFLSLITFYTFPVSFSIL